MIITLLCKVVDNFGDIGVVYRLAKQLNFLLHASNFNASEKIIAKKNKINLVVDDLISFNCINSKIDSSKSIQDVDNLCVVCWKDYDFCYEYFSKDDGRELGIILECFQCGRPDWMEKILFEDKLNRTVNTIMIDYLTAEKYADDFHCLASLTRSAKVTKVNFMPGFTNRTGGLIIEDEWKTLPVRNPLGPALVFTYERNWDALVQALVVSFDREVWVAQGRGKESFLTSWKKICSNKKAGELEYLDQRKWDEFMKNCSVLFIRGEESMSRACLSGIPFVWHSYPQSDEYQMVKVDALLERLHPHFTDENFLIIKNVWYDFNSAEKDVDLVLMKNHLVCFLQNIEKLASGFCSFAMDLRKNGDLAANLMTYIKKIAIIEQ